MNTNTVVSLPAAEDLSGYDHVALTIGANGVSRAGTGDRIIGTLMRGNVNVVAGFVAGVTAVDVFLAGGNGFHYAPIGNDTTIVRGDDLQGAAGGALVKQTTGRAVAVALEGSGASPSGGMIRVLWVQDPSTVGQLSALTQDDLTDSSTGTPSTTLAAITSTTPADLAAVGTQLGIIKNAIASLAAELAKVKADNTALRTALLG